LGGAVGVMLAGGAHGYNYHPRGRGPRPGLVAALSPAAPPGVWSSELLRRVDPPPLPHQPRKAMLQVALHGVAAPDQTSVSVLARALASEDHDVRVAAVGALARVRSLTAVKAHLVAALRDREARVRRATADALLVRRANCRAELGRRYRDLLRAHRAVARQQWAGVVGLGPAAPRRSAGAAPAGGRGGGVEPRGARRRPAGGVASVVPPAGDAGRSPRPEPISPGRARGVADARAQDRGLVRSLHPIVADRAPLARSHHRAGGGSPPSPRTRSRRARTGPRGPTPGGCAGGCPG